MPHPPFVLPSVLSRRAFLALLSWRLCSVGEDELQDRHGERYHSQADDCSGGDNGCGCSFVPVVGFQNDDISGWRQHSEDKKYLRVCQELVEMHSGVRVHPVCGG